MVTSKFVNMLLYSVGVFSVYDMKKSSIWRTLYQIAILCFITGTYFVSVSQQIRNRSIHYQNPFYDLGQMTCLIIITISFIYTSAIIISGIMRTNIDGIRETIAYMEHTMKELNNLKIKMGIIIKEDYDNNDTTRIICYMLLWVGAYIVDFYSLSTVRISILSFALGFTFVNNSSWFYCTLVEYTFICWLKLMTCQFQTIGKMLMFLLQIGEFDSKINMNQSQYSMENKIRLEHIKSVLHLYR